MAVPAKEMHSYQARLATFENPHHLAKRRASAQSKKKAGNTIEWPHKNPAADQLARAGFFYRPASDSADNVQCFLCTVKLDGWEPADDPIQEHLAHSRDCAWAKAISVHRYDDDEREAEMRDPLSDEMIDARRATFTTGDGWPHENKKGWKCKISKMLEAGWTWDPAGEGEDSDGVTCFYCNLSLDGWEPKDDPFHEHSKRSPACRFFELVEYYHGVDTANGKVKKSKARGNASARSSTLSKVSRTSTNSVMSAALSIPGSFDDGFVQGTLAGVDDSVITTATDVSRVTTASTTKGAKKTTKPKAATKGAKSKNKTSKSDDNDEAEMKDADEGQIHATRESQTLSSHPQNEEQLQTALPKAPKRGTRTSKQVETSVTEVSQVDMPASKKTTRGRKAKVQIEAEEEPVAGPETPDAGAIAQKRLSEVSAQLQEELEHSVDNFDTVDESTPVAQPTKPKRGAKRTSDGMLKQHETQSSTIGEDTHDTAKPKPKRGRPKKLSARSDQSDHHDIQPEESYLLPGDSTLPSAPVVEVAPQKKGKGRTKSKKASSTRSSRSTKATAIASEAAEEVPEDLARDEMEIEQELRRIASEQAEVAIQAEQDHAEEFETSPSQGRASKDGAELDQLRQEVQDEGEQISKRDFASPPRRSKIPGGFSPSPAGSDKENQPSSVAQPSFKDPQIASVFSPTRTIRIPLAAGTPNRPPVKAMSSPSKQISHLTSSAPWASIDLDTVLLASPQPSPNKVSQQLIAAAGALTSPEKTMSVEEWVRHRAERGEEELRRRCEQMVAAFEKEGMRGLETLQGINAVG